MNFFDLFKKKKSTEHTLDDENLTSPYTSKLDQLNFEFSKQCKKPSEKLIKKFEKKFGLKLPEDYRLFLLNNAGKSGSAVCPFKEPTPMGSEALINNFYGFSSQSYENIFEMTKLIDGYPVVIALGSNDMGSMFWYICQGARAGQVVMHDGDCRSSWTDERFFKMFSNLAPEIKEYLELRKESKLPQKEEGFEHIYLLADSFSEFIENLNENVIKSDDLDDLIYEYVDKGKLEKVKELLDSGLDINYIIGDGWNISILELAVICIKPEIVEFMISNGAETKSAYERACKNTIDQPKKYEPIKKLIEEMTK